MPKSITTPKIAPSRYVFMVASAAAGDRDSPINA